MGGKGEAANKSSFKQLYKTIGKIGNIKVLEGIEGCKKHGLPIESHSSDAYIKLNKDRTVKQIRILNSDRSAKADIECSVHQGKITIHAHDFVNDKRQNKRDLTESERNKYLKYFGGI